MMIDVTDLTGAPRAFSAAAFLRMRRSFGAEEPQGVTYIRLDTGDFFAREALPEIVLKLREHVAIAELRNPIDAPVAIRSERVGDVSVATQDHHPEARSVVTLSVATGGVLKQQVREDVAEARRVIDASLQPQNDVA